MFLVWCRTGLMARDHRAAETPASASTLHVTHILGFEGISNNANGDLSIQGDTLQFRKGTVLPLRYALVPSRTSVSVNRIVNKGQGEILKSKLEAAGAHIAPPQDETTKENTQESNNEVK